MRFPLIRALAALTRSGGKKLLPAEHVDLACFMGPWRVIACMDNAVERDFVDAVETYTLRPDGTIEVHFRWRDKSFNAAEKNHEFTGKVTDSPANAQWKMKLFPFISVSYVIIAVQPQYEWAAVAHPSRKFGWVLARGRALPESTFREIMRHFEQQGYDTRSFIRVPQFAVPEYAPTTRLPRPAFSCA